ncbi:hypothetical protein LPJ61_000152 [Coemansia biformis]|uniref:DUF3835 domain-containing protein n=1 Tax=Coemansia biformis TaxID=1286918 RepID=A0A9W7YJ58_9FUNG|nr:hypothetical protein LPJ61_000152 [Coemansia biformis]
MSATRRGERPGAGGGAGDRHHQQSVSSLEGALKQYSGYKAEYHELQQTLLDLPAEIEYDAMVPVGPLAFFPGKLINTNEILVLLGDNWFVERSAKQAAGIAGRRESYVDAKIAETKAELAKLKKQHERAPKDPDFAQLLLGAAVNEDGDEFVDIKETLPDGQQPAFDDVKNDEGQSGSDVAAALEEKRQRMIRSLQDGANVDRSLLGDDQRRLMELLDQIEDEEGGSAGSQGEDSHGEDDGPVGDDGDAYSDEDYANAARDDDEDDYNDNVEAASSSGDDEGFRMDVVERQPATAPEPSAGSSPAGPRGILKPPTPVAQRRGGKDGKKSVSFGAATAALARTSQGLGGKDGAGDDVDVVTRLLGTMATPSAAAAGKSGSGAASKPGLAGQRLAAGRQFEPSAAALSRARLAKPAATEQSAGTSNARASKGLPANEAAASRPLRSAVVEASQPAAEVTHDMVDADMHAREIAQAYNRKRFKLMSAGVLDGAAEAAEKILAEVTGVTLVSSTSKQEADCRREEAATADEPECVSLADLDQKPPEVVSDAQHTSPPGLATSAQGPAAAPDSDQSQSQPPQAKPNMSRFKARRLGLED